MRPGALADIFFPRICFTCDTPLPDRRRGWLCDRCLARLVPLGPSPCPACCGPLGPAALPGACRDCRRLRPRFSGAVAVGRYEGLLRELVVRMKYGPDVAFAWPLGDLLAETLSLWPRCDEAEVVVPMPTSLRRRTRRGFNPAELLARDVARRLRLPIARFSLVRRAGGPAQAGLPRSERLRAPRGTMHVRAPVRWTLPVLARLPGRIAVPVGRLLSGRIANRTILLVDDVLTTGATANEAARALLAGGAAGVLVGVAARA